VGEENVSSPEIVIIMGPPASGKTSIVNQWTDAGYCRINRDSLDRPGKSFARTDDCAKLLAQMFDAGQETKFVLDNTYGTRKQRKLLLEVAAARRIPVKAIVLNASIEQCQLFAALRMIRQHGKLMDAAAIKEHKKTETKPSPGLFPPMVLFSWFKKYEPPELGEGFASIEDTEVQTYFDPEEYPNRALILDYDGTLRVTKSGEHYPHDPDDIVILPTRPEVLQRFGGTGIDRNGYRLLGASNQSGIAKGVVSRLVVDMAFQATNDLLGADIEYLFCPHRAGPPQCYCRKPMPGMGAWFIEKYKLNPDMTVMVGDMKTDETFAKRCGFEYMHPAEFFPGG
jgi:HAD superfamily hydrolase (TIGR01662 family)